jgi:tripartite-type tricarboxylate transporter receptor subunit TctC
MAPTRLFALTRRLLVAATFVGAAALSAGPASAEYPERPITIVVCFPAGGGTDISARLIQPALQEALGKPVIIENRGGAGGNIAIAAVQRMAPDGYTLLACSSAFVVNPSLYASVTYDPLKDFEPVMVVGASPNVFVVPTKSDIKDFKDLLARAKANPGKLNWTSPGAGTTPHLAGELIKLRTGVDVVHIPFPGAGPASQAAAAGQVDYYTANIGSVGGLIQGGTFRPIAVTATQRYADMPDVPTLEELGIKDAASDTFQGLYAPGGTPRPIVDRLAKELKAILAKPDLQEKFRKSGLPVVAEGPDEFAARIKREVPMYKEIIDKGGLKMK